MLKDNRILIVTMVHKHNHVQDREASIRGHSKAGTFRLCGTHPQHSGCVSFRILTLLVGEDWVSLNRREYGSTLLSK